MTQEQKQKLADIRERWKNVTPGVWGITLTAMRLQGPVVTVQSADGEFVALTGLVTDNEPLNAQSMKDANAIAHAKDDVQFLLNLVDPEPVVVNEIEVIS